MSYFRWITIKWFSFSQFCSWITENSFGANTFHLMMRKHNSPSSCLSMKLTSAAGDSGTSSVESEFPDRLAESLILCLHGGNMRWRTDKTRSRKEQICLFLSTYGSDSEWDIKVGKSAGEAGKWLSWPFHPSYSCLSFTYLFICFTKSFGEASGCAGEL